jgi:hypothetical protein
MIVLVLALALAGCSTPRADRAGFCAEGNQLQGVEAGAATKKLPAGFCPGS